MKLVLVILTITACHSHAQTIEECLQKDSISCVQKSIFRKAKEFFDKDSLELLSGVSLIKKATTEGDVRAARSGEGVVLEQQIEKAQDVAERQSTLENYVSEEIGNFFYGRSLKINFASVVEKIGESARAFSDSIPAEVKQAATEIAEGRGKKKLIKHILPLMAVAKLKLGALITFAYFAIALIAKKAILASLLSLAVSSYISMRSFFYKNNGYDNTAYSAWNSGAPLSSAAWAAPSVVSSGTGWSSAGAASTGWDDAHTGFSAQNQAYSGYHH